MSEVHDSESRRRLLPGRPLPAYAHVPGRTPHPFRDAGGHSFGVAPALVEEISPSNWSENEIYLHGIDLFNFGYYWEAHEAWESLWHACGRKGLTADYLKGLIKLAAGAVKVREAIPEGAKKHARRSRVLFESVAGQLGKREPRYLGLRFDDLISSTRRLETELASSKAFPLPLELVVYLPTTSN